MNKLTEIANKAIEDYGFRQTAMWSPEDVSAMWKLNAKESKVMKGVLASELEKLPVPVEPKNYAKEKKRFEGIIKKAIG
ncbi:MAG: hypothetical protein FJ320_01800 [SAR202 cluster bacterium]|nr:hypothetical protein [SAR202 cluster bacterium]